MRMPGLLILCLLFQDSRRPEPPEKTKQAALKTIQEIFKDDYARKTPEDRRKLGRKLLEQAAGTNDDPPSEFMLLQEARRLAAESGDARVAMAAVMELERRFEIDARVLRTTTLSSVSQASKTPEDLAACAVQYIALAEDAARLLDSAAAEKALASAASLAKSAKNIALLTRIDAKMKQLSAQKMKLTAATRAQEILAKDPEDAEANGVLGTFMAFDQEAWEKGLPYLIKGKKCSARDAAELELANPSEAAKQAELGDAWWSVSDSLADDQRRAVRRRASVWYERARQGLSGLAKAKIEKRLSEVPPPEVWVPPGADPAALDRWKPSAPVSISAKQGTLKDAVAQLGQETGTAIAMGDVDPSARVTYRVEQTGVLGALDALCRAGGVSYTWNQEGTELSLTKAKWWDTAPTHLGPFLLLGRAGGAPVAGRTALWLYLDWEPSVKPVWYELTVDSVISDGGAVTRTTFPPRTGIMQDPNLELRSSPRATKYVRRREYQADYFLLDPPPAAGKMLSSVHGKADIFFPLKWGRARFDEPKSGDRASAGPHQISLSLVPPRKLDDPWFVGMELEMAAVPVEKRFALYGATLEAHARVQDSKGRPVAAEFVGNAGGSGFGTRETFTKGSRYWTVRGLPATETFKSVEFDLIIDVWRRNYSFELKDVPYSVPPAGK